jgi:ABC-2 type transport system permease protein
MLRLIALIEKEIIQVLRDPFSLMVMFVMPGLLLILFGVAISLDVDHIDLAVWDLDKTPASREFVRALTENGYFTVVARVDNDRQIRRMLDSGTAKVALKIPPDFERSLKYPEPAPVSIIVDGSDNNTASITLSYISLIIRQFSTRVFFSELERGEISRQNLKLPVELEPRIWYNPELLSENFFVPGLIGMVMMVTTTILTSMSIIREKERGTIEMLMVSPLPRVVMVIGKITPYFIIALINMFILVLVSRAFFHVPFRGSGVLLFLLSALFLITALGFGVVISTLASSQQVAWTICMLTTTLPSFLLSGFIFPIENMPWGIQLVTYLFPIRYFIVILRGIILKGVGVESLLPQITSLAIFAFVALLVSSRRIARRLT